MVNFRDDGLFPDDDLTALDYAFDGLAGIGRGTAGFLQAGYSLADALAFDALPDFKKPFFGESRTGLGTTVELLTQFALGFASAPFAIARIGSLLGTAGKLQGLGALAQAGVKVKKGAELLRGTGLVVNATKGAVADFAFFETQDSILSTLASSLDFQDELGDFFGASADELGFFEGRLRNALEGAALGTAVDGLMIGARKLNAFRKGKEISEKAAVKAANAVKPKEGDVVGKKLSDQQAKEAAEAGVKKGDELRTRLTDPTTAEATSKELLEKFGSPLRRPFTEGDLPQVSGEGAPFTRQLISEFLDGEVDVLALMREGRGDELTALLKRAVDKDVKLPGLTEMGLRVPDTLDDFVKHAHSVVKETNNMTDAVAAEFLVGLNINAAKNTKAARAAFITSQVFLGGAEKSVNKTLRKFIAAGDFENAVDLLAESALGQARVVQSSNILMSEAGKLLRTGGFAKTDGPTFVQVADEVAAFVKTARNDKIAQKKAVATIKRYLGTVDEAGTRRATATLTSAQKGLNILQELHTNNLLAGIRTFTVTGLGGSTMLFLRAAERFAGNLVIGTLTLNPNRFARANSEWRRYWSTVNHSFREALAAARGSFAGGSNIAEPGQATMFGAGIVRETQLGRGQIIIKAIDNDAKGAIPLLIRAVQRTVTLPSRTITGIDQFFRQLGSRAEIAVQLDALARKSGLVDEIEVDLFIADRMTQIVNDGRFLTKQSIQDKALQESLEAGVPEEIARANAREAPGVFIKEDTEGLLKIAREGLEAGNKIAFTERFDANSIAGKLKNLLDSTPTASFVIPFFSTPIQIMGAALERSLAAIPIDIVRTMFKGESKILRELRDPKLQAAAAGRLALGAASAGLVFDMVDQGLLTGAGPVDIGEKRALEATGWRPYSVKVEGTYFSYARLDPIASVFGLYADIREHISMFDPAQKDLASGMFAASIAVLNGNFVEKTYMKGLADFLDIFDNQNKGRNAVRFVQELGANITGPGVFRNISDFARPEVVQVHNMWSRVAKKWSFVPGIDDPEPFRNVLGETVPSRAFLLNGFLPIEYSATTSDVISGEMARIGFSIHPDSRLRNGVNLKDILSSRGQSAYDRWQQLRGQVHVNGRTLTDTLSRTIRSRRYKLLPDEDPTLLDLDITPPKEQELRNILSRFRAQAFQEMLEEFPELRDRELLRKRTQRLARQGRLSR